MKDAAKPPKAAKSPKTAKSPKPNKPRKKPPSDAKSPENIAASRIAAAKAPRYQGTVVDEELVRQGGALLGMLAGRAQELGHNRTEMAKHLNVTYGYIAQLSSGHRLPQHISAEFAEACTRYLGVPKLTVLMAAGVIKVEDALEKPDEITTSLPLAMQFISRDPEFGALMPPELLSASETSANLQFFIVRLYEKATARKLIPGEHTIEMIANALDLVERRRQDLMPSTPRPMAGLVKPSRKAA